MNQPSHHYPGFVGVETVRGGPGPTSSPHEVSMEGMLDQSMHNYDSLPINSYNKRSSIASLESLASPESTEAAQHAGHEDNSTSGPGAAPLPSDYGAQLPSGSGIVNDFTRRKNWADRVVQEIEDLIQILTSQGRFIYVSLSCEKLTGYTQAELAGKYIVDFIHEDDSTLFQREFNESIASGNTLRFFYRFRKKDNAYAIFESHGHPHLARASQVGAGGANYCPGYFMMARQYPTKNASLLDSFLEHKIENERLTRRINELAREEEEEVEETKRRYVARQERRSEAPSDDVETTASTASTPIQSRSNPEFPIMTWTPNSNNANGALTQQNLVNATASNQPDSIRDKMARYEGTTHVETIEMLTGLNYREGERSQGISTGCASPILIPGEGGSIIPPGDKRKKFRPLDEHVCTDCGTLESPEWRRGPTGPKSLCNACGLRWAKLEKKAKIKP